MVAHQCIINLQERTLQAGGQPLPFHVYDADSQEPKSVCHVYFPETTVLPGKTEKELPLSLSTSTNQGIALLEPVSAFVEKYGVLIAHSLTLTGTGKTMVHMLNPSSAPVTIYQNERVGELHPVSETVCNIKPGKQQRNPAMVEKAIEQLLPDSLELKPPDKEKL